MTESKLIEYQNKTDHPSTQNDGEIVVGNIYQSKRTK